MPSPVEVSVASEEMNIDPVAQVWVHLDHSVVKRVQMDVDVLEGADVQVFTVETI